MTSDNAPPPSQLPVPLIIPVLLVFASSVSIFSTDFYAPSLPHLPAFFGSDAPTVQLTMSLNLAAFAIAQLIHGPLADRFGRRLVILGGMAFFALASVGCAMSETVEGLILFRILQGLTISAEAVVVMVVIRDLWEEAAAAKVMAAYGMSIAMAPAVGPIIGGYVHVALGWQANFWILAILAVFSTAALARFLPETGTPDKGALRFQRLFDDFSALLRNRAYMAYVVVAGLVMGGLFAFITEGPFIIIARHGVPTENYGYYQAAIVAAYFCGSLFANRMVGKLGIEPVLRFGLLFQLLGGFSFVGVIWSGVESPITVTAAVSFFVFALGLVFSTAPIRALTVARGGRGSAAALLGAFEMGMASLGAFAVSILHDGTAAPAAYVLSGCAVLGVVAYGMAGWGKIENIKVR
jgi:DHA1 family bicyclomycin/chloramphenicol resistance-like MFS transporter